MRNGCFVLLSLLFLSCSSVRKEFANPAEIKDVLLLSPLVNIFYIEKGNHAIYSDSVSFVGEKYILKTLKELEPEVPITNYFSLEDSKDKDVISREMIDLFHYKINKKALQTVQIPPYLSSLMQTQGKRFGLLVISTGFTRKKGNYGKQMAKGLGVGILTTVLTGGMMGVYSVPVASTSNIDIMIIDANANKIVFRQSRAEEIDPLDLASIQKQIKRIFEGYFLKRQREPDEVLMY